MKVLNLYAGIGGNRKLWDDVDVTAVEWDEETANVYQDYFPEDEVVVADAHQYLLDHFDEFDFIWSSPPCPTHSKLNNMLTPNGGTRKIKYPDMKLYEEIILLQKWHSGKFVIENVDPFYEPLIPAKRIGRHLFWGNFKIPNTDIGSVEGNPVKNWSTGEYERYYGYDLSGYRFTNTDRRQKLRNCVHPEIGKYILDRAREIVTKSDTEQTKLFE